MMNYRLSILVVWAISCTGCYYSCSTTHTEVMSISGPTSSGGKVIDPNLYLTCNYPTSCKITLRDRADREVFSHTAPPAQTVFSISLNEGSLTIKTRSGKTLATIPTTAAANAALHAKLKISPEMKQNTRMTFYLRTGDAPNDPFFELTVDPDAK